MVEKIQSANSRLIADMNDDESETTNLDKSHTNKDLLQSKHRVTFSSDVEEYVGEDEYDDDFESTDVQYKDDDEIDREVAEIIEADKHSSLAIIETDKMDGLMKFMTIEEKIYPDDEKSVSGENNEYSTQLEAINVIDKIDECHGTAIKSKSNDQAVKNSDFIESKNKLNDHNLPCRACTKTDTTIAVQQQPSHRRPTSSKPVGTEQYKKDINQSKNRIVSASASNRSNDLFKIHLNVRTCCENKYLDNNRLPRYNGYNSQYGLSKDQMEQRKLNHQKWIEQRTRRNREILKAKEEIAYLNEQAFRQWLIRKNHLSRSKYKNMYDF